MKKLNEIIKEIEANDNLSITQILKMDVYEYKKDLLKRAQKILKNQQHGTN